MDGTLGVSKGLKDVCGSIGRTRRASIYSSVYRANITMIYVGTDQLDCAFERLNALAEMPNLGLTYGDLKTHPSWDPLRKDPRFEKLLAKLAPRD
jgi:hypothetical protein